MSLLSLGLLLPLGTAPDRALTILENAAGGPAKHVTLIDGSVRDNVETRAQTVADLLAERGIIRRPDDRLSTAPDAPLVDGSTVTYRPAVTVNIIVDGVSRHIQSSAATVGELVAAQGLAVTPHDDLSPSAATELTPETTVRFTHTTSWLERVRSIIAPPVAHKYDVSMVPGTHRIIDAGAPGTRETTVAVLQPSAAVAPKRMFLAERVLRLPRMRIVAEGVGDGVAISEIAQRGFVGTMRLADAALKMIATAYTAGCSGCSGRTASGRVAGHGVVAVDPRIIPLGTHLFIPGYGHALAGDTGGAIRGNRIDLGFNRNRDALTFGRRSIVVYVLK